MRSAAWVCLVVGVALSGCDIPQAQIDTITCNDLCDCIFALPTQQARCDAQCIATVAPVDDACAACVADAQHVCSPILSDCLPMCVSNPTPLLEGEP